jgi:hypothetical protein
VGEENVGFSKVSCDSRARANYCDQLKTETDWEKIIVNGNPCGIGVAGPKANLEDIEGNCTKACGDGNRDDFCNTPRILILPKDVNSPIEGTCEQFKSVPEFTFTSCDIDCSAT